MPDDVGIVGTDDVGWTDGDDVGVEGIVKEETKLNVSMSDQRIKVTLLSS